MTNHTKGHPRLLQEPAEGVKEGILPFKITRSKFGFFPSLAKHLATIDLQALEVKDPLAYAKGYLMGKRGLDSVEGPSEDYWAGWALGHSIWAGEGKKPSWDKGP
jgi:hypothetical protein